MALFTFNIAKGAVAEKFRDGAAKGIVLLLTAAEADAALKDHDDLAALIAAGGNTEASDPSYARKTGLTGTVTVDDVNDRTDVDLPDQTFAGLAGSAITNAIVAYEESAADTGRIPCTNHPFAITPDGTDVELIFNAAGFFRASEA